MSHYSFSLCCTQWLVECDCTLMLFDVLHCGWHEWSFRPIIAPTVLKWHQTCLDTGNAVLNEHAGVIFTCSLKFILMRICISDAWPALHSCAEHHVGLALEKLQIRLQPLNKWKLVEISSLMDSQNVARTVSSWNTHNNSGRTHSSTVVKPN